ncbi:MAG: SemiSWEET family transporter [Patescibacteria group bacterium]
MKILEYLVLISGIAMSLASFPQAYKIFKTKSARDVSLITYTLFFIGGIIWVIYGINIGNFPILYSYALGNISSLFVLIGIFKYKN